MGRSGWAAPRPRVNHTLLLAHHSITLNAAVQPARYQEYSGGSGSHGPREHMGLAAGTGTAAPRSAGQGGVARLGSTAEPQL